MTDRTLALAALAATVLMSVALIGVLAINDRPVPDALTMAASTALGVLGGVLAPTAVRGGDGDPDRTDAR